MMSDNTKIQWTETTWNPLAGCSKVSAGCKNCYAIKEAHRLAGNPHEAIGSKYSGTTTADGKNWTGKVFFDERALFKPLSWRKPRRIFVNSMSDLFHESVPDKWIDKIFAVMALCPQHTFQILTKRSERMRDYLNVNSTGGHILHIASTIGSPRSGVWPRPNVWLGVSVENQETADERIPHLLRTPAAVRFISAEPLLGSIELTHLKDGTLHALDGIDFEAIFLDDELERGLDWVIVGGESGTKARPCNVENVRQIVSLCKDAGVAVLVKQLGRLPYQPPAHEYGTGYYLGLKDKKGGNMDEWPEDLRVRQFPFEVKAIEQQSTLGGSDSQ